MTQAEKVINWVVFGSGTMPPLIEPQPEIKKPILTDLKQIEIIDQGEDSVLIHVKSGDDLLTPEERLANYLAGDGWEEECDDTR